jgi:hypothetical protein
MIAGFMAALLQAAPIAGQPRPLTDAECQGLRDRLAEHAKLSDGVRLAVAGRAAASPAPTTPAPAPAPVPSPAPAASRADEIRARLEKITVEHQQATDSRLGAITRFELTRAAQYQAQIATLDQEKLRLQQELAGLPAGPSAPAPSPGPAPTPAAPRPVSQTDRLRCQDMQAAYDEAVRIRQRELGAKEGQAGVIPLMSLKGQTAEQIGRELAAQLPSGGPGAQIGLLDLDGDRRLDGFVDMPVKDVYRLYRLRPDGALGVEVFVVAGNPAVYGDLARRLEETGNKQTGRTLADLLATRPAGPMRVTAETADFATAYGHWLAGNFVDAARLEGAAARGVEFQNLRGEVVRVTEIVAPVTGGVALRRLVVQPRPNNQEQWDETTIAVRPVSYLKIDVEIGQSQETRSATGAPIGARATIAPIRFSLDR